MLCEVSPVPTAHCPAGAWSKRATQRFIELTENRKLAVKVKYKTVTKRQVTLAPKSCKDGLCINKTGLDWFVLFQVYSQVKNVLRVHVYDTSTEEDIHINQLLIDEGFAMYQEESHASKVIQ